MEEPFFCPHGKFISLIIVGAVPHQKADDILWILSVSDSSLQEPHQLLPALRPATRSAIAPFCTGSAVSPVLQ